MMEREKKIKQNKRREKKKSRDLRKEENNFFFGVSSDAFSQRLSYLSG